MVRVGNSGGSGAVSVEKGWTEWVISVCLCGFSITIADLSQGIEDGSRIGIDPKLLSLGQ